MDGRARCTPRQVYKAVTPALYRHVVLSPNAGSHFFGLLGTFSASEAPLVLGKLEDIRTLADNGHALELAAPQRFRLVLAQVKTLTVTNKTFRYEYPVDIEQRHNYVNGWLAIFNGERLLASFR
ncbi:hypothetical protein Q5752_006907 [Cryptotrichosporon argae]